VLGTLRKAFEPSGVTILLLLAESHVSLHTYPEEGRAFFDAFTCGVDYEPSNIFHTFASTSLRGTYKISRVRRGDTRHEEECRA
jgi:S-adenosylmethionine decarboxylase